MSLFLQQLHIIFTVLFCMVSLVLFATTRTNSDPLQVLSTMAPKQDRTYARGRSKSVAPSERLIISSDDERDPEYVPPGTFTPSRAARAPRATPKKVASGVVTASQFDEFCCRKKPTDLLRFPPPLYSLPRLTRPPVWNPHPVHQLVLSPRLSTSPTGGVSRGSIKSIPMQSS